MIDSWCNVCWQLRTCGKVLTSLFSFLNLPYSKLLCESSVLLIQPEPSRLTSSPYRSCSYQSCCPSRWLFQRRRGKQHCLPRWSCAVTTQLLPTLRMFWSPGGTSPSVKTQCWSIIPQVRLWNETHTVMCKDWRICSGHHSLFNLLNTNSTLSQQRNLSGGNLLANTLISSSNRICTIFFITVLPDTQISPLRSGKMKSQNWSFPHLKLRWLQSGKLQMRFRIIFCKMFD